MYRLLVAVVCCAVLVACEPASRSVVVHPADAAPDKLSAWGVLLADGARLRLNDGVVPYDLNTPLFSDYALKLRTIWLPEGSSAVYAPVSELDFPVGTIISKTFHYEKSADWGNDSFSVVKADRESSLDASGLLDLDRYVMIETRLLVRYTSGWRAYPYVWNRTQDEAFLELAGDQRSIELINEGGAESFVYIVPDANQCGGCHMPDHSTGEMRPLGPKAWQLNRDYTWWGDSGSQLDHWVAAGLLQGLEDIPPSGPRWSRPGADSLGARAKAYLDVNCGHCHNAAGAADTSALHLNRDAPVNRHYGVCKTPVAVGRGSGDRPYDIYPGQPDDSILLYRMQHSDPAIAMPELGRGTVHAEGVDVIRSWILSMNGEC